MKIILREIIYLQNHILKQMDKLVTWLIIVHATAGGVTLIAGLLALIAVKGSTKHIMAGKVFFYAMIVTVTLAFIVSVLPGYENYFLTSIAVFSAYFIITGFRIYSLNSLPDRKGRTSDKIIAGLMTLVSLLMIGYGVILNKSGRNIGWVLIIFGALGILTSVSDQFTYRKGFKDFNGLVMFHIPKMIGGYIAAWTAFLVVNNLLPGLWSWLTPTALVPFLIIYFQKKYKDLNA